jgi:predicted Zn finger-like uncharacterized protein
MITVCTSCRRQFRIKAEHLSRAKGLVQCGFCGEQFNALDHLYDKPLSNDVADSGIAGEDEPRFELPEPTKDRIYPRPIPAASVLKRQAGIAATEEPDDIVLGLLAPEQKTGSRITTVLWSFATLMLLLISTAQLAWFNRDQLLARFPQFVPQVRELCDRYDCELLRERDLDAIALVNRDVRDHPRYNDALLVNITIENRSVRSQPYPGIQFMLFDSNGTLTGYRRIQPSEYLEPGAAIDEGMRPRLPLHLVLEVVDILDTAVGFEFDFF